MTHTPHPHSDWQAHRSGLGRVQKGRRHRRRRCQEGLQDLMGPQSPWGAAWTDALQAC